MKWGLRTCTNMKYNAHTNNAFCKYRVLKFDDMYTLQILLLAHKFITKSLPIAYENILTFHHLKNRKENLFETLMPSYKTKTFIGEMVPKIWNESSRTIHKSITSYKNNYKKEKFNEYGSLSCKKRKCYPCGRS